MNSISCFIIDDQPSIITLSEYINSIGRLKLFGTAVSSTGALPVFFDSGYPDILFINIDKINEFDLILQNYISKSNTLIIVTSEIRDNAYLAFESGFFDYLLKPFIYERFMKTITRVIGHVKPAKEKTSFYIQTETKGNIIKIVHAEIKYVEAKQNYINIVCEYGEYLTHQTMKSIEERLPSTNFIRVHKSFIVNEIKIQSVHNDFIILKDKTLIKVGPNYREKLISKLLHTTGLIIFFLEIFMEEISNILL